MGEKQHFQNTFKVMYDHLKDYIGKYQEHPYQENQKYVEAFLDVTIHVIADYAERFLKYTGPVNACIYVNNTIKHIPNYTSQGIVKGGITFPIYFPAQFEQIKVVWKSDNLRKVKDKTQKEDYLNFFAGKEVLESLRPVAELIMNGVEEKYELLCSIKK